MSGGQEVTGYPQQQFNPQQSEESMDTSQGMLNQVAQQATGNGQADDLKIFVGGLSWDTDDEKFGKYFQDFGEVAEAKVKYDSETNQSRGFGFVVFTNHEDMDKVLQSKTQHVIDNRKVDVKKAIPHAQHQAQKNRTKKIFVGGVPTDVEEPAIREYFQAFGEIEEVALVTEKETKKRRGFCFVTFTSEDHVDLCTEQTFHQIRNNQVEVKRATPRDQGPGGGGAYGGRGGGGRGRGRGGGRNWQTPYGVGSYGGGYGGGGGGGGGNYYGGDGGWGDQGYGGGGYGGGGGFSGGGGYGGGGGGYSGGGGGYGGYGGGGGRGGGGGGGGRGGGGGGGQGGGQGFGSRYGPMKGGYNHSSGNSSYHPYSR